MTDMTDMTEYTVLYHDPVRLCAEDRERFVAGQSVWVCRSDRYAFEVHVFAPRDGREQAEIFAECGEARYRLALALLGGSQAFRSARADARQSGLVVSLVSTEHVVAILERLPHSVAVNFGDVIYRFEVGDLARSVQGVG